MSEELRPRLLLGDVEPSFVPDVTFGVEGGEDVKNTELEHPVTISYRYCDDDKAQEFHNKSKFESRRLVKMFCGKIVGLEEVGITDGATLISAKKTKVVLEMIDQVFERIIRANRKKSLEDERND